MDPVNSVDFAAAARTLTGAARRCGLTAPSYRSPPRLVGIDRSIRRRGDTVVVSVRLRGRPWAAVLADMVEGVVVSNGLGPPESDRVRAELWNALERSQSGVEHRSPTDRSSNAPRPAAPTRGGGRPAEVETAAGVGVALDQPAKVA